MRAEDPSREASHQTSAKFDDLAEIRRLQTEIVALHKGLEKPQAQQPPASPTQSHRPTASTSSPVGGSPTQNAKAKAAADSQYDDLEAEFQARRQSSAAVMTKVSPYSRHSFDACSLTRFEVGTTIGCRQSVSRYTCVYVPRYNVWHRVTSAGAVQFKSDCAARCFRVHGSRAGCGQPSWPQRIYVNI